MSSIEQHQGLTLIFVKQELSPPKTPLSKRQNGSLKDTRKQATKKQTVAS